MYDLKINEKFLINRARTYFDSQNLTCIYFYQPKSKLYKFTKLIYKNLNKKQYVYKKLKNHKKTQKSLTYTIKIKDHPFKHIISSLIIFQSIKEFINLKKI